MATKYYKIEHLIKKETEKAVFCEVNVDMYNVERDIKRGFWFPKSQIKNGFAAEWLLCKKIQETEQEVYAFYHSRGRVDRNIFADCVEIEK